LEHNGSPPPVFETDDERLSFVTILYQHPEFASGELNGSISSLSANESKARDCMHKNPYITRQQLCEELGVSIRTVDRIISALIQKSLLIRQGSRKTGYWDIVM